MFTESFTKLHATMTELAIFRVGTSDYTGIRTSHVFRPGILRLRGNPEGLPLRQQHIKTVYMQFTSKK